ncbi:MAG: hypothetical protein AB7S26_37805 [Sandaracinaceae bacterium]
MGKSAKRRTKKKNKGGRTGTESSGGGGAGGAGGGGVLQSLRSGFKNVAGVGESDKKESALSNILWTVVLIAAIAFAAYRCYT